MKESKGMTSFFDDAAQTWTAQQSEGELSAMKRMLSKAGVSAVDSVLDVAAGTGGLVPLLAERGVVRYTALELSRGMMSQFQAEHPGWNIIHGNFEEPISIPGTFSVVVIFNAVPHFSEFSQVFRNACAALTPGGRLVLCHSRTRAELKAHHVKMGRKVENDIIPSDDCFRAWFAEAGFSGVELEDDAFFFAMGHKL